MIKFGSFLVSYVKSSIAVVDGSYISAKFS